jgi:hypothetical protein
MTTDNLMQKELNRECFMAATGVYVTPSYFRDIKMEYRYFMKYNSLTEDKALEEFPHHWLSDYEYAIIDLKKIDIKFCTHDIEIAYDWANKKDGEEDSQLINLDLKDIINRCSGYSFQWQEAFYKQLSIVHKLRSEGKIKGKDADELLNNASDAEERLLKL